MFKESIDLILFFKENCFKVRHCAMKSVAAILPLPLNCRTASLYPSGHCGYYFSNALLTIFRTHKGTCCHNPRLFGDGKDSDIKCWSSGPQRHPGTTGCLTSEINEESLATLEKKGTLHAIICGKFKSPGALFCVYNR